MIYDTDLLFGNQFQTCSCPSFSDPKCVRYQLGKCPHRSRLLKNCGHNASLKQSNPKGKGGT